MLGREVVAENRRRGHAALGLSHVQGDITDPQAVAYWVGSFRPQLVVNCAAFTRVDECEERRDHAFEVNARGAAHVAAAAARAGARLVHLSTDYVFDGRAQEPYPETAPTGPLSVYGESKLAGEKEVLAAGGGGGRDPLVVRTSWLFGAGGPNFVRTLLGFIEGGQRRLTIVADQTGCPTYTPFLARALCDLAASDLGGVVHYRNREPVSWYELAVEVVRLVDRSVEVVPITTAHLPRPAARPAYSVLDVTHCEEALGREVEPWGWGLVEYLALIRRRRNR